MFCLLEKVVPAPPHDPVRSMRAHYPTGAGPVECKSRTLSHPTLVRCVTPVRPNANALIHSPKQVNQGVAHGGRRACRSATRRRGAAVCEEARRRAQVPSRGQAATRSSSATSDRCTQISSQAIRRAQLTQSRRIFSG